MEYIIHNTYYIIYNSKQKLKENSLIKLNEFLEKKLKDQKERSERDYESMIINHWLVDQNY